MSFSWAVLLKPLGAVALALVVYFVAKAIWHLIPEGKVKTALFKERGSHPPD